MKIRRIISLVLTVALLASMAVFSSNAATIEQKASGYYNQNKYSTQIYNGEDLGATYSPSSTTWKVWSPGASAVQLKIYKTGSDQESGAGVVGTYPLSKSASFSTNGVWELTLTGDYKNLYYTYLVTCNGTTQETQDVYSKATGVKGERSMVVDLDSTDPEGWNTDKHVLFDNMTEAAVWEVHVRDFSIAANSGVSDINKGKYLAFTEGGTTLNGDKSANAIKTGVDYLVEQGINCVQIMPVYDFQSVDETKASSSSNRNWGYDPQNYNVPEGSYSSDPYNGNVRITEFKQMVQALHDRGISVVMDVVYNHTYTTEGSCFSKTVPGYYYRMSNATTYSNGSGCGNEVATENQMARNFIVQSVKYWADEYHIDGFRFDLMGCIDVTTMNTVRSAVDGMYADGSGKKIMLYGEPWTGGTSLVQTGATTGNASKLDARVGMFSDAIRNALTGGTNATDKGWIEGVTSKTATVVSGIKASLIRSTNTTQTITYADCHDNVALWDHLTRGSYNSTSDVYINEMKLAYGTILTSQGIKFGLAGDEFARTKQGDHNSYKSSDEINQLDWSRVKTYSNLVNYIKGLRLINKVYTPFHDDTVTSKNAMKFISSSGNVIAYTLENKTANASNEWGKVAVLLNCGTQNSTISLGSSGWTVIANQNSAGISSLSTVSGNSYSIPGRSVAILVESSTFARLKNAQPTYGTLTTEHYVDGVLKKSSTATYKTGTTFRALPDQDILFDNGIEKIDGNVTGTVTANMAQTVKYYYKYRGIPSGYLTVKYVDSNGKSIAEENVYRKHAGDTYAFPYATIDGYQLDSTKYPAGTINTFDGNDKTISFVYKALSTTSTTVHYYNSNRWSVVRCYAYTSSGAEPNGAWSSAKQMTADSSMGSGWFTITVPAGVCKVMFHNGGSSQEPGQGEDGYPVSGEAWIQNKTVTFNGTIITSHIDVNTGKQLVADEVQNLTKVTSNGTYTTAPKAELGEVVSVPVNATGNYIAGVTNVVYLYNPGGDIKPTYPTTEPTTEPTTTPTTEPTTAPTTAPTTDTEPTSAPENKILVGDVDLDKDINVKDATLVQMSLAKFTTLNTAQLTAADVDYSGKINIKDATFIQLYCAKLNTSGSHVGEYKGDFVNPTPTNPTPTNPIPTDPIPTDPIPTDPTPTNPIPTDPIPTDPIPTDPIPTDPLPQGSVKFTDNQSWGTVYAYFFGGYGDVSDPWPGTPMNSDGTNDFGENVFIVDIPEGATHVIFTNGTEQTVDVELTGEEGYYTDGTKDENGKLNALPWSGGIVPDPGPDPNPNPNPDPTPSGTVKFTDNQNWGTVYAYFWSDSAENLAGVWPGTPMSSNGQNEYSENVFIVDIPQGATYVIFSNGSDQTVDITLTGAEGYYTDGSRTDNKLNALPWQ